MISELEDSHIRAARLIHNLNQSIPLQEVPNKTKWNSLVHYGSIVWNCLPNQVKLAASYPFFNVNLKKYSKTVDQISFGSNSTTTNNNTNAFVYFLC